MKWKWNNYFFVSISWFLSFAFVKGSVINSRFFSRKDIKECAYGTVFTANEANLVAAVLEGRYDDASFLISDGVDVDACGEFSPLVLAVKVNDLRSVKFLLEMGADINFTGWAGESALLASIHRADPEIFKYLLNNPDCDINYQNKLADRVSVSAAIAFSNSDVFGPPGTDAPHIIRFGHTPLIRAVSLGPAGRDKVKALLEKGARIDLTMNTGETALFIAAKIGDLEGLSMLIDRADPTVLDIIKRDVRDDKKFDCDMKGIESVQGIMIIKRVAAIRLENAKVYRNLSYLLPFWQNMIAALVKDQYRYARRILSDHLRHFQRDHVERLAIQITGYPRLAEFFNVGKIGMQSVPPLTPDERTLYLNIQTSSANPALIMMIRNGTNINFNRMVNGSMTFLMCAAERTSNPFYVEVVRELIGRGSRIDIYDNLGENALFKAAKAGNIHVLRYLIEHGGMRMLNVKNWDGNMIDEVYNDESTGIGSQIKNLVAKYRSLRGKN